MDPDCISAAGNHVNVENRGPVDWPFAEGGMGCIAGSIGSVGVDLCHILARPQEIQRDVCVSLFPICQRPNIPICTASPGERDVSHREAIDDTHFIPGSRYQLDKIEILLPL